MKKLISLLICIVAIYIVTTPKDLGAQALRVLLPVQGGTGISTSSPTDVGKCIKVLSDSPFKYELASCSGVGGDPTIIQVDGTPQSVGTPTLNFTGNSFAVTESPADTFSLRVSTSTLGLLASSISDFVSTVRTSISETIEGLTYTSGTGVLSLDSGYTIPTTTRAVNWDTAFGWGNHASQGYITDGNTNWDNSYNFVTQGQTVGTTTAGVVGQIPYWTGIRTLGTVATTSLTASGALSLSQPISVIGSSASALTCLTASGSQAGCLSTTDWTSFNGKVSSTSIDSLTELETLMSGINIIASTELDTETEFQNLVGGLNFITTNDTSAITPAMVFNTGLTDEYCLTYETTGSTWEWQTCGTGGVNSGLLGQVARYNANGTAVTGTSSIFIADNTNVGVGTTTPENRFVVGGAGATSTFVGAVTIGQGTNRQYGFGLSPLLDIVSVDTASDQPVVLITATSSSGANADIRFNSPNIDIEFVETDQIGPAGKFEWGIQNDKMNFNLRNGADNSFVPGMAFTPLTGRLGFAVGIGTEYNSPGAMLSVVATSSKEAFNITSSASHLTGTEVGDLFAIGNSGIVSIGSSSPTTGKLTVLQTGNSTIMNLSQANSATTDYVRLESSASSAGNNPCIGWYNTAGAVNNAKLCSTNGSGFTNSAMTFSVANASKVLQERMRIDVNGFVGIGSTTPGFMLTVTGTSSLATTTQASSTIGTLTVSGNTVLASASSTNLFATLGTFTNLVVNTLSTFLNVTITGLLDVGGGVLEIPNGTAPVIDSIGEIGLDSTDDQLIMADGGGTARVFGTDEFRVVSLTMASSSLQFDSGDLLAVLGNKDGLEITQFRCYVVGGTSKVVNLTDGTNDTETITCGTTMTSDTDVATNDTFTADEIGSLEMGATTGTVNYLHFEAWARITRE